jgi:hypothetical protein
MQKNALAALAHTNPTRAFELFQGMDPPEPAEDGSFPEDLRASGATTIFPEYWHSRGHKSLPNLRRESQHLGEAGEYPFLAVAEVLKELGLRNAGTARSWIAEAVSYYRRGSRIKSADADFVYFIEEVQQVVPLPVLRDAVDAAVDRLVQKAEAGGKDSYTLPSTTKRTN